MESHVKQKGKKEIKEGKAAADGDTHNPTAEYARMETKNAAWRERKEGERSYLPPDFEKWGNGEVTAWMEQNAFSAKVREKMASLTGKDLKTLTDARLKGMGVGDEKDRREVLGCLAELQVILENVRVVK